MCVCVCVNDVNDHVPPSRVDPDKTWFSYKRHRPASTADPQPPISYGAVRSMCIVVEFQDFIELSPFFRDVIGLLTVLIKQTCISKKLKTFF